MLATDPSRGGDYVLRGGGVVAIFKEFAVIQGTDSN